MLRTVTFDAVCLLWRGRSKASCVRAITYPLAVFAAGFRAAPRHRPRSTAVTLGADEIRRRNLALIRITTPQALLHFIGRWTLGQFAS